MQAAVQKELAFLATAKLKASHKRVIEVESISRLQGEKSLKTAKKI